jgi:Trk-type K+ transport system membrane component
MKRSNYILRSLANALGTVVYVILVALFMFNGKNLFDKTDNFLMPVFMLLLFILSASVTGLLVLGKPVLMYLDNLKKEAVIMLLSTLGWIAVFLIIVFFILFLRLI